MHDMQFALMILAWLMAIPLSIILIYLTAEIASGLTRSGKDAAPVMSGNWSGVILVPAHNEASGIAATVEALQFSAPDCRILVVADNCTDETASLARTAGAETISRSDPDHRGKGFALAYGRDFLAKAPPDAVVVIDADCRLSEGSVARLVEKAVTSGEPVQSVNLLERTVTTSPLVDISNFAMLVKNLVRARGLARMGGGVLLFGTGMAFPWKLFARLDLATSNAVEDIELGLALARRGVKVSFEDGALVTSPAASIADSKGQRSRWEHGFLQAAAHNGLPLLFSGLRQRSRHLVAIGAHMLVPPLAMLMLLSIFMLLGVSIIAFWSGYYAPLLVLLVSFFGAVTLLLVAWWKEGRDVITYKSLMRFPFYIMWKIPIYLGFFTSRQTGWNRTRRDGEKP
ncbi:glycosyltransferase family 2 protein [uncultured Parasphingorhabdus sp.]|uniref:glycosyltransferase family 2 protein n=1 Tax=uncultured Parasphingorhabdus sp. TaxID=2709694 RepID=UPI0030D7E3DA|tara:strand:+ start:80267 stop:81466 length:1200 start_codon:yes stop_codon:yes gene_type:complete